MPIPYIIPGPHEDERLRSGYNQRYDERLCEAAGYPAELPQNTRFNHNPDWRNDTFWSIQRAHDCSHWGWKLVRALWIAGQFAGPAMGFAYAKYYR